MDFSVDLIVDLCIAVAVCLSVYLGWRQGAFASVLSMVGVLAGLICGAAIAPLMMSLTEHVALRFLLALGVMVMLVGVGNLIGGALGANVREQMKWRQSLVLDSIAGAMFQAFATLTVLWLVSIPVVTGLPGPLAQGIQSSRVLGFVDRAVPTKLGEFPAKISAMLSDSGLPPLISPFNRHDNIAVAAPAIEVEDVALIERLRPAVVHVVGSAPTCAKRLMGSGFVVDNSHVITNAHVVAGTDEVSLESVVGTFPAEVVFYDPQLDIAVLHAKDMNIPPLPWATRPAASGQDAVVMGFPAGGPFEAAPARVRESLLISGTDIYAQGRIEREAYTVRGTIRQGNSGGPMINLQGEVIGVVFGADAHQNSDIGYALTAESVQAAIGDLSALTQPVGTKECILR